MPRSFEYMTLPSCLRTTEINTVNTRWLMSLVQSIEVPLGNFWCSQNSLHTKLERPFPGAKMFPGTVCVLLETFWLLGLTWPFLGLLDLYLTRAGNWKPKRFQAVADSPASWAWRMSWHMPFRGAALALWRTQVVFFVPSDPASSSSLL